MKIAEAFYTKHLGRCVNTHLYSFPSMLQLLSSIIPQAFSLTFSAPCIVSIVCTVFKRLVLLDFLDHTQAIDILFSKKLRNRLFSKLSKKLL